ncbi:MAG: UxaA family hydrolase, partial [Oribacterium sp.]|nr:UxaA family hydrolase [Oribacterium sp.]
MAKRLCIQITEKDNVAIAINDLPKGTEVMPGVVTAVDIPQAHKIALKELKEGTEVIRYGVCLGTTSEDIPVGGWVNEKNLIMAPAPDLDSMKFATNLRTDLPKPKRTTWMGYKNPNGFYAGTRNILGINTTVQCVAGVLNVAIKKIKAEILPKYPNVDDVVAINHPYGCGVAIDAPDAYIPQKIIRNIAMHPNFGGVFMLVSLGCEKFTVDRFCEWWPELNNKDNVVVLQEHKGYQAMMDAIIEMAEKKLKILNERKREELPLSDLLVG